ncbi:uncharacterized protein LOC110989482 isoform X2 [Acanthaster planci]|uniref:Uncharacterized protein LOC110989482 isoform X2 n=1 Tax=Acanthaster planci TaxID=133434 RepID=A0A8B7ZWV7_ACAPL|nr:uncharacterized protein LOC110989482 isoform X2 [Acanthaster planci]
MTASPEQLRDISVESARPSRLEETPAALTFSDVSRLSESRDSTQPSSLQMEQSTLRHKRRLTEKSIEEEVTIPGDQMLIMDLPDEILPEHQIETLQDIPEVHKSPDIGASEEDQVISVPHPNVIREIAHLTAADETITFKDLVPVTTTCTDASKVFSVCLAKVKMCCIVPPSTTEIMLP